MSILDRATILLQLLSAEPGRPWTIAELAQASDIHPSGCTRILQQLVQLAWVDQAGRRGAYRLGPRAYSMTGGQSYQQELLEQVTPSMRQPASHFPDAGVVLAILQANNQHILWECGAYRQPEFGFGWLEQTAWHGSCCRVLVAHLPPGQRQQWIKRVGFTQCPAMAGSRGSTRTVRSLGQIRQQGFAASRHRRNGLRSAAVMVTNSSDGNETAPHAAIGIYSPTENPET